MPATTTQELLDKLASEDQQDLSVDGTERRINRPHDNESQKKFYSGKKKAHTLKNIIIGGNNDTEIKYLSVTTEGKKHDKKSNRRIGDCFAGRKRLVARYGIPRVPTGRSQYNAAKEETQRW